MADVPNIVIRRLASGKVHTAALELHPDANLLAAFVEQSLASRERVQVLDHLAQCFECREIVALAVPELATANVLPRPVPGPWLSWPVLRWGAAIACVVVVGAAVTLREREAHQARSGEGKPGVVSVPATSRPQQEALQSARSSVAPADESVPKARAGEIRVQGQAVQPREKNAGGAGLMARGAKDSGVPGRAKDDLIAAQPLSSNAGMAGGAPLARPAVSATANQLVKSSPMRVPRWTLTSDGTLERSLDMGRSWEPITIALEASLHALAANGLDIWVGGTAGALYHSDDAGEHWTKVQPIANGQPLIADIIGVEFTDFEHGRLNTASGEVWTTDDAGLTWQKQ
jgi:hypothetical protein